MPSKSKAKRSPFNKPFDADKHKRQLAAGLAAARKTIDENPMNAMDLAGAIMREASMAVLRQADEAETVREVLPPGVRQVAIDMEEPLRTVEYGLAAVRTVALQLESENGNNEDTRALMFINDGIEEAHKQLTALRDKLFDMEKNPSATAEGGGK